MDLIASEFGVFPLAVVEFDEIDRVGTEAVMLVLGIAKRAVCVGPAESADMVKAPPIAGAEVNVNTISRFALRMRVASARRSVAFIGPITIATIPMPPGAPPLRVD